MPFSQFVDVTGDGTTVDSVAIDQDIVAVEVLAWTALTDGVLFTVDGVDPSVDEGGPGCWYVPPGVITSIEVGCAGRPTVKFISGSAGSVRLTGITADEQREGG